MIGVSRRYLQRYNLRYPPTSSRLSNSNISNYQVIGAAQYHTLLSSTQQQLQVCKSSGFTIPTSNSSSNNNVRYFTSIFRSSMINNHLSDTQRHQQPPDNNYNPPPPYETPNSERRYRRQYEDTTRRGSLSPTNTTNRGSRTNSNRGRQKIQNVRLIQESAAIETIQLFKDGYNDFISSQSTSGDSNDTTGDTNDSTSDSISNNNLGKSNINDNSYPWNNATSLLGAEQTLEYYARCNKTKKHLPIEDVESSLSLFKILHSLHHTNNSSNNNNSNRKLILTNGMYSHIIDILSKSKSIQHVELANTLLQQFIGLYISNVIQNMDVNVLLGMIDDNDGNDDEEESFSPSEDEKGTVVTQVTTDLSNQHDLSNSPNRIKWNYQDHHEFPNQVRITGVMRGYAQTCTNPIKAEELLNIMIELSNSYGTNKDQGQDGVGGRAVNEKEQRRNIFQPNEFTYATVIDAYSRIHDGCNAERILQLMKQQNKLPNVVAYNTAITAWSRCTKDGSRLDIKDVNKSREAADNAQRLLREMWIEHDKLQIDEERISKFPSRLLPDVISYSSVISAYATCFDQPYGMKRAHELVIELEGLAKQEYINNQGGDGDGDGTNGTNGNNWQQRRSMNNRIGRNQNGFQPNTMVYNTLLQVYAEEGDASTAEQILQSMMTLHSQSIQQTSEGSGPSGPFRFIKPNVRTFNVVLNAWAKSDDRAQAGVRAMKLLDCMMNDEIVEPDVVSYNTALNAWSSSASVDPASLLYETQKESEGDQIKPIVGEDAAYEALKLLDKIEGQYIRQSQANSDDEIHVDKPSFDKERYKKLDKNAKARSRPYNIRISYSTTIAAFANATQHSKDNGTALAEQAEGILNRMIDKLDIEPDAYGMNGVILAWARSSGGMKAAEHAESLFRSMKIPPTIVSWSSVVNAYALADGAHKAEALLQEMEENGTESSRGRFTPTTVLCNNVLHSWGKSSDSDASRNAEKLLERMESTTLPRPDVISYRIVLTALEHCLDNDKAERAKSVHDRFIASLDNSPVKVDPREIQNSYNSVLTACAYTPADAGEEHRSKAGNILVGCLRDMNQFPWSIYDNDENRSSIVGPNQETYALFMQGCSHLYDSESVERNEFMKAAFRECCKQGLLNEIIWNKFSTAMGQEMIKEFIQELLPGSSQHFLHYEDLPKEWSSGVSTGLN